MSSQSSAGQPQPKQRRTWVTPRVLDLPRLTDLTLTTGSPIPGSGDTGGGSTVVP
jgi:hypothetical protein